MNKYRLVSTIVAVATVVSATACTPTGTKDNREVLTWYTEAIGGNLRQDFTSFSAELISPVEGKGEPFLYIREGKAMHLPYRSVTVPTFRLEGSIKYDPSIKFTVRIVAGIGKSDLHAQQVTCSIAGTKVVRKTVDVNGNKGTTATCDYEVN